MTRGARSGQASYERNNETGLDYAMFRYDSSRLGRFMTPDPIAGSLSDSQSLNRYAYTRNDPVNLHLLRAVQLDGVAINDLSHLPLLDFLCVGWLFLLA